MADFKPFSLAESIQSGQRMRMNQLKLQQAEAGIARQTRLRGLAEMSQRSVYGEAEGPPLNGVRPQIQTGTEYDPMFHAKSLQAAGETEEAAKVVGEAGEVGTYEREEQSRKIMASEGEYSDVAKALVKKGDLEGGAGILKFGEALKTMDRAEAKEAREIFSLYAENLNSESMGILQSADPRAAAVQSTERLDQQFPKLSKALPDFDSMSDEQITKWAKDNAARTQTLKDYTKQKTAPFAKIDPSEYTTESLRVFERTGLHSDLDAIDPGDDPGSEFERHLLTLKDQKNITPEQALDFQRKRVGVLSGAEQTAHQKITTEFKAGKEVRRQTEALRKEASGGTEHFSNMNQSINDAIAAVQSGDNALADTLLAQSMSQVQDTNVRAMQMYKEFDRTFGNIAERTIRGVSRFISGRRTAEDRAEIVETLKNFRESHVLPGLNKMKNIYRDMARGRGLDPFEVIPPRTPEEIRDYPGMLKADKLKTLKLYFPEKFQ